VPGAQEHVCGGTASCLVDRALGLGEAIGRLAKERHGL
jgi:hypothetical protein